MDLNTKPEIVEPTLGVYWPNPRGDWYPWVDSDGEEYPEVGITTLAGMTIDQMRSYLDLCVKNGISGDSVLWVNDGVSVWYAWTDHGPQDPMVIAKFQKEDG